jgi:RNA polymerase sigma-70 factor (ECF subfamily)
MQPNEVLALLKDTTNQKGFDALYGWFHAQAIGFLIKRGRLSIDEANDVFQETIIKIFKNMNHLTDDNKFESWVWQILRNTMTDHIRKNKRMNAVEVQSHNEDMPEESIEDYSIKLKDDHQYTSPDDCVSSRLTIFEQNMPDRHYAIRLQMNGLSIKEISNQLGRTLSATKEFLSQSRKKLKPFIEDCLGVEINE